MFRLLTDFFVKNKKIEIQNRAINITKKSIWTRIKWSIRYPDAWTYVFHPRLLGKYLQYTLPWRHNFECSKIVSLRENVPLIECQKSFVSEATIHEFHIICNIFSRENNDH